MSTPPLLSAVSERAGQPFWWRIFPLHPTQASLGGTWGCFLLSCNLFPGSRVQSPLVRAFRRVRSSPLILLFSRLKNSSSLSRSKQMTPMKIIFLLVLKSHLCDKNKIKSISERDLERKERLIISLFLKNIKNVYTIILLLYLPKIYVPFLFLFWSCSLCISAAPSTMKSHSPTLPQKFLRSSCNTCELPNTVLEHQNV